MPAVLKTDSTPSAPSHGSFIPVAANRTTGFDLVPGATGRRVVVLAVHHVRVGERIYTGGAEKYIQSVVRALLDAGATVHVGYSGSSIYEDLLNVYDPRRLTVEQTGWLDESLSGDGRLSLETIRDRRRWLRATRADSVLAVQQASGGAFVASLLAARTLGLRVVSSIRQSAEPLPPQTPKRWFGFIPSPQLWRRRLIWRKRLPALCCHAIVYNSRRVAEAYQSAYGFPERRAHVIFNGERMDSSESNSRRSIPMRIASVARVSQAKGADTLLDAFAIVARRHPEAKLTYFGDGDLIPALTQKAQASGLNDRVAFAGYVSSREDIYRAVDICVLPSRRESLSNSIVEAMAHGIPCVVSDVGGMREAVVDGENGFVVPSNDADAYADAICRLMADRDRYARFSRSAVHRARREFDLNKLMRKTVRVILGIKGS